MGFVSYPHLRLLTSNQTFEITVALEIFWNFKGTKHGLSAPCYTCSLFRFSEGEEPLRATSSIKITLLH